MKKLNFTYLNLLFTDILFSGYVNEPPTGVLWYQNSTFSFPNSLFISYMIENGNDKYVVDENYNQQTGSTIYRLSSPLEFSKSISNKNCLGGVFLLEHESYIYAPGFQSNNIWIVDAELKSTIALVPVQFGTNPHSIYLHAGLYYVLCRGDENQKNSNYINIFRNFDLSMLVNTIDLEDLSKGAVSNSGPRHGVFVDDSFFIITEFTHQLVEINITNPLLPFYVRSIIIDPKEENAKSTGAEIRYYKNFIYASLRIDVQDKPVNGKLYRYSLDLRSFSVLTVGKTPRFFNIVGNEAIVLNMDSNSYTTIDLDNWQIMDTVSFDPSISPQCFI